MREFCNCPTRISYFYYHEVKICIELAPIFFTLQQSQSYIKLSCSEYSFIRIYSHFSFKFSIFDAKAQSKVESSCLQNKILYVYRQKNQFLPVASYLIYILILFISCSKLEHILWCIDIYRMYCNRACVNYKYLNITLKKY